MPFHAIAVLSGKRQKTIPNCWEEQLLSEQNLRKLARISSRATSIPAELGRYVVTSDGASPGRVARGVRAVRACWHRDGDTRTPIILFGGLDGRKS